MLKTANEAVALDVLEALQLAHALVDERRRARTGSTSPGLSRGDVAGRRTRRRRGSSPIEEALLAVRDVRRLQPEQRVLRALLAVFEQRAPEHRLLARRPGRARRGRCRRPCSRRRARRASDRASTPRDRDRACPRRAISASPVARSIRTPIELRLLVRLGEGVAGRRVLVDVDQVRPHPAEELRRSAARESRPSSGMTCGW